MADIRLSVVTPCYNSAGSIEETLKSVENQSRQPYEHIIIDGGSTDGTLDLITAYAERTPYEVRLVSEPDDGIYDAMNKGIRLATGDLIGIINSD
ncbi:MAG: glycosyltransferase, partial [Lachnospiraceae bacterium]|nr:glycosyltransferase [Lachnospiraceae bacterium]